MSSRASESDLIVMSVREKEQRSTTRGIPSDDHDPQPSHSIEFDFPN